MAQQMTGEMRCDRCLYWTKPDRDYDWSSQIDREFGQCERTPHSEDVREWGRDNDGVVQRRISPQYADRTALAQDGSGYHAELITKPEHFCAMFKALEAETV